jgi:hypothetical protein
VSLRAERDEKPRAVRWQKGRRRISGGAAMEKTHIHIRRTIARRSRGWDVWTLGVVLTTPSGYTAENIADKQLILELGAYVGFSGVSFSRVSHHSMSAYSHARS